MFEAKLVLAAVTQDLWVRWLSLVLREESEDLAFLEPSSYSSPTCRSVNKSEKII